MVTRTRPMGFRERVVTLIRRTLTVPLFGLPPTPHELATWLVTYGTGDVHAMHRLQKTVTIGAESTCDVVLHSPIVSGQHCRVVYKRGRRWLIDDSSNNGTLLNGTPAKGFALTPGMSFALGDSSNRFIALNEEMRQGLFPLVDIVRAYNEPVKGHAVARLSPSEVIIAAAQEGHLLITGEPHCRQDELARLIHKMSPRHEHPIVEWSGRDLPTDRDALRAVEHAAARTTLVLDLADHDTPMDPTLASALLGSERLRVIVLARSAELAERVLGERHIRPMLGEHRDPRQHLPLHPLTRRPDAILRLIDHAFKDLPAALRTMQITARNRAALCACPWKDNFAGIRLAAQRLDVISRQGTFRKAAEVLEMSHSSLQYWYANSLGLSVPLMNRDISQTVDT